MNISNLSPNSQINCMTQDALQNFEGLENKLTLKPIS